MADEHIKVEAQPDAFMRIARARPVTAIAELIWNSLDADASQVTVYLDEDAIGLRGVIVEDDGTGITPDQAREYFKRLGGSWKTAGARTAGKGRVLHGRQGQGRYKTLSLGDAVEWRFFYPEGDGFSEFTVTILSGDPSGARISESRRSQRDRAGCIVSVRDPVRQFTSLDKEESVTEITETFAIYLSDYPQVSIDYIGNRIDPSRVVQKSYTLTLPSTTLKTGERAASGTIRILEWKSLDRRSLYVCDARGFALEQINAKFHLKPHSFSAYLQSPYLDTLEEDGRLDLAELDPLAVAIIENAKNTIKLHFEEEDRREASRLIEEWKSDGIYPYVNEPANEIEEAERQVFDIVAIKLQKSSADLENAPNISKKLNFELLRYAVETGPSQLKELLSRVVELPQREQDELAQLLEQTTLSSIISATKLVTDRLNFLRGLYQIAYEYTSNGRIKERSQLHRILSQNAWLFGEEFFVSADDEDLTAVLKAHKRHLGEPVIIDDPVKHISQTKGIIDLMLSRSLRRHRADEVEHLIVELKRPGVPIGSAEIRQIKDYAASIEADGRFSVGPRRIWHFWVISDKLAASAKFDIKNDPTGRGVIHDADGVRIIVRTWQELIDDNKARYQFIQERLNFTANGERAMAYLRQEHAALLEGVVVKSDEGDEA